MGSVLLLFVTSVNVIVNVLYTERSQILRWKDDKVINCSYNLTINNVINSFYLFIFTFRSGEEGGLAGWLF